MSEKIQTNFTKADLYAAVDREMSPLKVAPTVPDQFAGIRDAIKRKSALLPGSIPPPRQVGQIKAVK
jgi:hypothetical protein